MRIVFMGTPDFAASVLSELASQHEVVAVYTRPDAVRGRGKQLVPSPVKVEACERGIPVFTPKTLRDADEQQALAALEPDVICVAAYGMLLPAEVLSTPEHGCLNVHASLLPRWRGAAPIERAILSGDEETGVCIMRMEEGLDTGDYCVCRSLEVGDKDVALLTDLLADLGAHALLTALTQLEAGCIRWTRQDEEHVTYAEKNSVKTSFRSARPTRWSRHAARFARRARRIRRMPSSPARTSRCLPCVRRPPIGRMRFARAWSPAACASPQNACTWARRTER